jgi:hypothetical protein
MAARRDCQKVLLRRPFSGFAIWLAMPAFNRDSERCAAARDPPSCHQPRYVSLRRHDTGRACRPAQGREPRSIRPQSRNGIAHGNYQHYIWFHYPQEANFPGHRASLRRR